MAQLLTIEKLQDDVTNGFPEAMRPVKRCFYIYGVKPPHMRGRHRHHRSYSVLQCVVGSVAVYVQSPDGERVYHLDSPTQQLVLEPAEWRLMFDFSPDALLMVFTNQDYDPTDYIDTPYYWPPNESALADQFGDWRSSRTYAGAMGVAFPDNIGVHWK